MSYLVPKHHVQDIEVLVVSLVPEEPTDIILQFRKAVSLKFACVEAAKKIGKRNACDERRKIRVPAVAVGGHADC